MTDQPLPSGKGTYHEPLSESPLNPFDLTGHVAIVTGGNGGLGLAMARGLARAGASVALAARDESKGQAAVKELILSAPRTRFYAFQASSASSCRKLIETVVGDFAGCDILINNAGMNRRKPPEQISEQEWHEILDVNLGAALFCAQAAYPHMKAAGRGKILNIGSMYSLFGAPTVAAYAASKGGLVHSRDRLPAPGRLAIFKSMPSCPAGSTPTSRAERGSRLPNFTISSSRARPRADGASPTTWRERRCFCAVRHPIS